MTYTQVWYIIGIVSSSPTDFHSEKIGLIRVTYDPPVSARVNICISLFFSLSFFSVLTSDCIELDFKEIFHLVISIYYLCFWDQLSISMFKYWSKTDLIYDADIRQGCSLVIAQFVWKWNPWIQSLTISRITNISNTNKDYIRLANRCITLNTWWGNVILNISIAL